MLCMCMRSQHVRLNHDLRLKPPRRATPYNAFPHRAALCRSLLALCRMALQDAQAASPSGGLLGLASPPSAPLSSAAGRAREVRGGSQAHCPACLPDCVPASLPACRLVGTSELCGCAYPLVFDHSVLVQAVARYSGTWLAVVLWRRALLAHPTALTILNHTIILNHRPMLHAPSTMCHGTALVARHCPQVGWLLDACDRFGLEAGRLGGPECPALARDFSDLKRQAERLR